MELKLARQIARLTQRELAVRAGVDEATISRLERAERSFTAAQYGVIVRIARDGLGLPPADLLTLFPVDPVDGRLDKRPAADAVTSAAGSPRHAPMEGASHG